MLLAIDAGNTNVVFALCEGTTIKAVWRCATDPRRTADEYAAWLLQLMTLQGFGPKDVDAAIIGSVVPRAIFNLKTLCQKWFHQDPVLAGTGDANGGIRILMDPPGIIGADCLANAVAAGKLYGGPCIVVDFGTASTFSAVSADGSYEGIIIIPGPNSSLEALHQITARLPRVEIARPPRVIGKTTVLGMQSGVFWGYIGLVENLVRRMQAEYGQPMKVIATGGLSGLFSGATDIFDHVDPELTLKGLCLIHALNRP
ncbi:MAG: type III pantothenate kinase [Pseudomonadota bacterium]|nr:type III pantothenate kinase [Pseudomonadota bacterium]